MDSPLHDILFGEIPNDPARRSSVQLASELPRPRRPMPRQMRPQAGPTRAQTTYGGQQGDVSRLHGFRADAARQDWLHGGDLGTRLRGAGGLLLEATGLPSVRAEAEALGRRDWASAGQEAPAAAMTAAGPALGLFGRRASVAPPRMPQQPGGSLRVGSEPLWRDPIAEQTPGARRFTSDLNAPQRPANLPPSEPPTRPTLAVDNSPSVLHVYHGSGQPLNDVRPGLFTTNDFYNGASRYATRDARRTGGLPRVTPLEAKFRNPMVIDGEGRMLESTLKGRSMDDLMTEARANGHDGITFRNVVDSPGDPRDAVPIDVHVVVDPSSVTTGRPNFINGGGPVRDWVQRTARNLTETATPAPVRPARIPTRASDGSVLPAREPQPFRQAEVGGSGDLSEAAAMRPRESDAGSAWREHLRAQGFDVDTPLYHGTSADFVDFDAARGGQNFGGRDARDAVSLTSEPWNASDYAMGAEQPLGAPNVRPVFARGRFAEWTEPPFSDSIHEQLSGAEQMARAADQARADGFDGLIIRSTARGQPTLEYKIFADADGSFSNIAPRFGSRPVRPDGGSAAQPPINPRPDSTLSGSAGGFAIPPVVRRDFQRMTQGGPSPAPSQRALQGPGGRLTAMSRAGAPEMRAPGSAPSGLLQTPKGASQQSAIDPRVILGGGALGMFPTGAATAALVRQNAEENAVIDRMAALQRENKRRFAELRAQRAQRPYQNPGRLDPNRTITAPFGPNPGFAISPANGRVLPVPADAPRDSKGRFVTQQKARHLAAPGF